MYKDDIQHFGYYLSSTLDKTKKIINYVVGSSFVLFLTGNLPLFSNKQPKIQSIKQKNLYNLELHF